MHRMYEQWHPLGVVGIITAFNFPVAVWSWNAFLAAVCGDVCVWKPSPKTPLCAIAVQKHRAIACSSGTGCPAIFQLFISAGNELAEQFVDDRRVDLVSFTGSTAVGRKVGERVAARLGKSLLELGGNNAIIVDEFANLDLAVPVDRVRRGRHRRPALHDHAPRVRARVARRRSSSSGWLRAYAQVRIGDPLEPDTLMGPLIDAARGAPATSQAIETPRSSRRHSPVRRQGAARPGQLRRADDRARAQRLGDRADTRPSRRSCT